MVKIRDDHQLLPFCGKLVPGLDLSRRMRTVTRTDLSTVTVTRSDLSTIVCFSDGLTCPPLYLSVTD